MYVANVSNTNQCKNLCHLQNVCFIKCHLTFLSTRIWTESAAIRVLSSKFWAKIALFLSDWNLVFFVHRLHDWLARFTRMAKLWHIRRSSSYTCFISLLWLQLDLEGTSQYFTRLKDADLQDNFMAAGATAAAAAVWMQLLLIKALIFSPSSLPWKSKNSFSIFGKQAVGCLLFLLQLVS